MKTDFESADIQLWYEQQMHVFSPFGNQGLRNEVFEEYVQFCKKIINYIQYKNNIRFLDCGCGTLRVFKVLDYLKNTYYPQFNFEYQGVDDSLGMRSIVKEYLGEDALEKMYHHDIRYSFPSELSGKYSAILYVAVIHNFIPTDLDLLFLNIRGKLEEGGILAFLVPEGNYEGVQRDISGKNYYLKKFTPLSLTNLLLKYGYTAVSCTESQGSVTGIFRLHLSV